MGNIITNYICETNFILGIFIGIIFAIAAMILIGLWMDRNQASRVKKDFGEDFETVILKKSEMIECFGEEKYNLIKEANNRVRPYRIVNAWDRGYKLGRKIQKMIDSVPKI